jgi:hypothetical protein
MTEPTPPEVKRTRLLELATQIDYHKRNLDDQHRRLAKLKATYEAERLSTQTNIHRAQDKIVELSRELDGETRLLLAAHTTASNSAASEPHARKPTMKRDEAERKFGPVTWKQTVNGRHLALRRGWIQFVVNRPETTMKDFQHWFVSAGGPARSASPVFNVLKAWATERGWTVTGKGGRSDPLTLHRSGNGGNGIHDLATATPEEKDRLLQESRAQADVLQ